MPKQGPCSFSAYKPQLQFEVKKENNELGLKTNIMLNGAVYKLEEFQQYGFCY
jgi:hypothetical protein